MLTCKKLQIKPVSRLTSVSRVSRETIKVSHSPRHPIRASETRRETSTTCRKLQLAKSRNRRLTDHEVELMREMYEEYPLGHPGHLGYHKLSAIFQVSRYTVRDICVYRRRVKGL